MPAVARVRPVLLSAPYGDPERSRENRLHLPSGLRTAGFVEITLRDGTVGLGEAYLAVFAPTVFRSVVELLAPLLLGREALAVPDRVRDLVTATGYWSLQGAARHVVGAIETALQDCAAQVAGLPVWRHLGGTRRTLDLYASGGDSVDPAAMHGELDRVAGLGISTFKIRARAHETAKVTWTQEAGARLGIGIAVDMTQNLVVPSQSPQDVLRFAREVEERSGRAPEFLEEVLGPDRVADLPALRAESPVRLAGGETVTTESELVERVRIGSYDIVQPDATVIGGLRPVLDVFAATRDTATEVYVHCWGAGVGVLANYHAAAAGGGTVVEWPLPSFPLREELLRGVLSVEGGRVSLTDTPGLGIVLTPALEQEFAFREEAVYACLVDPVEAGRTWAWA